MTKEAASLKIKQNKKFYRPELQTQGKQLSRPTRTSVIKFSLIPYIVPSLKLVKGTHPM